MSRYIFNISSHHRYQNIQGLLHHHNQMNKCIKMNTFWNRNTHSCLPLYINNLCFNKMLLKSQVMMELNVKRVTWYMSHLISLHSYAFSRQTQVKDTRNTEWYPQNLIFNIISSSVKMNIMYEYNFLKAIANHIWM